jgi:hypothetical protein
LEIAYPIEAGGLNASDDGCASGESADHRDRTMWEHLEL